MPHVTSTAREPWVDEFAVAEHLGVPVRTVQYWRQRKSGPPYVKVGRQPRYRLSEVDEWVASGRSAA